MLDLVITGGLVLDGTRAPDVPADLGVAGGATFEAPHQAPVGFGAVVVNGVAVALDREPTGATPGRVLRRGRPDAAGAG